MLGLTVKSYYLKIKGHDLVSPYIRKNLLLSNVLKKMQRGENFYDVVFFSNVHSSDAREVIFSGIAENCHLNIDEVYKIWLNN